MISMNSVESNKRYEVCNLTQDSSLFDGYYKDEYPVKDDILRKLSKDLGFSYDLYKTMRSISPAAASSLVASMSQQSQHTEITLLLDEEQVVGYSLEAPRTPLLNSEFLKRAKSLLESSSEVAVAEVHYHKDDTISSVLVKRTQPITLEKKYSDSKPPKTFQYDIGVLLVNEELSTAYSRLVVYINGHPVYLPASYYNSTITRFKRSTGSSSEAFEVLLLKVIEDLRDNELYNKIDEFHNRYRANKDILVTYEEFQSLIKNLRRIPTVIEDNSCLERLQQKYEDFEKKYSRIDEQKSSYIWRCTAIVNTNIDDLIRITTGVLNELCAPPIEYYAIRELLGSYISTNRIATEIAME